MNEKIIAAGQETVIAASESLEKLVIGEGAKVVAPENKRVILTVDGVQKDLDPGTYTGDVKLSVIDGVIVDYETHGSVDHYCMANAVSFENGKYAENQSVTAAVNADAEIKDGYVKNLKVVSHGDNFGGVMVRDGEALIEDVEMELIGNGGCDFTGEGVGITAMGNAKVTVNRAKIHTVGSIRATVVGRESAEVVVNDSELFAADGDKPNNIRGMTKVPWMLGLTGRVRTTNLVDKAHVTYNRCHVKCENWGTFSTDGTQPGARLEMNDCLIESEKCGYGAYSIGECLDSFSHCKMNMGNYPLIMCAEGSGLFTNACEINSRKVGVMMHGGQGTGVLDIEKHCVFNTARAVLQVKGQGATINVTESELNSDIGIILERFPNDDPNMSGKAKRPGAGGPGGPGGGPGGPGGMPGGMGMPGGNGNQHRIAFTTYGGYGEGPTEAIGSLELIKELFQGSGFVGFFACPGKIMYEAASEKISEALKINKFRAQELIVRYKEAKLEYFTDYSPEQIAMFAEAAKETAADSFDEETMVDNDPMGIGKAGSKFWSYDLQNRPNDRDIFMAKAFLQDIIEDYYLSDSGEPRKPSSVYYSIN